MEKVSSRRKKMEQLSLFFLGLGWVVNETRNCIIGRNAGDPLTVICSHTAALTLSSHR